MNPLNTLLFILAVLCTTVGRAEVMVLKSSDVDHAYTNLASEVLIKSLLSDNSEKVYVDITLPNDADVGFEIYNADQEIQHLWLSLIHI